MANEYIDLKNENIDRGKIALHKVVLESIVNMTLKDENTVLAEDTTFNKAVTCKIINNELNISVDIRVKKGVHINEVCESLQERIFKNIYQMTDIKCYAIDVRVIGFVF